MIHQIFLNISVIKFIVIVIVIVIVMSFCWTFVVPGKGPDQLHGQREDDCRVLLGRDGVESLEVPGERRRIIRG